MEKFLYIDLNILSSLFLFSIFIYINKQLYTKSMQIKQLNNLVYLEIIGSLTEIAYHLSSYLHSTYQYFLVNLTMTINLLIPCLMSYYFSKFIYSYIFKGLFKNKALNIISTLPCAVNIILVLTNFKTNFLFKASRISFGYIKNIGFIIYLILLSFYLILNIYILIKYRKRLTHAEVRIFIFNNFFPILAAIPQIVTDSKIPTIWSANAISLILILLFMNKKLARYDNLTHVWTRYAFEDLISYLENTKNENFSLAIIDLKNLGYINSKYGFAKGNIILNKVNKVLKKSIKSKNIICRYRPNEFMILFFTRDLKALKKDFKNIRESFSNEFGKAFPNLDYYFYCEVFNLEKYKTYSNFLRCIEKNLIMKNGLYIKEEGLNDLP